MFKDRHHRLPSSLGGTREPRNISVVSQQHHRAYHQLFGNDSPREVARKLTVIWINPDWYMVAVPRAKRKPIIIKKGTVRILVQVFDRGTRRWARVKASLRK
jgi:hypothetical protein